MVTVILEVPGGSIAQYDETNRNGGIHADNLPQGLVSHSCSVTDDGLIIVDVWDSEADFQAFGEMIFPIMVATGAHPTRPKVHRTHNTYTKK